MSLNMCIFYFRIGADFNAHIKGKNAHQGTDTKKHLMYRYLLIKNFKKKHTFKTDFSKQNN